MASLDGDAALGFPHGTELRQHLVGLEMENGGRHGGFRSLFNYDEKKCVVDMYIL